MVGLDPVLLNIVIITFVMLLLTVLLKYLNMPSVVAYILAGVLLGVHGFNIISRDSITQLGSVGILLLLFFIGMEVDLIKIISNWKIAILGVVLKIILTLFFLFFLDYFFVDWSIGKIILLSFVLSVSSTAVVLKILEERGEMDTMIGANTVSVLLVQDIIVIPMIVILGFFGSNTLELNSLILQVVGSLLFVGAVIYIIKKKVITLRHSRFFKTDNEIQLFVALFYCFGFAVLSSLFHLSPTLGAFLAGLIVAAGKESSIYKEHLHSFYLFFMALFFLSIGFLINLYFLASNIKIILLLVLFVFVVNTLLYTLIFHYFKRRWRTSLYAGALLAQIGEFSFVLAAIGLENGIILEYGYQLTISVISITLILSPFWIILIKQIVDFNNITLSKIVIPQANIKENLINIHNKVKKRIVRKS